jgi:hypothetical protein
MSAREGSSGPRTTACPSRTLFFVFQAKVDRSAALPTQDCFGYLFRLPNAKAS